MSRIARTLIITTLWGTLILGVAATIYLWPRYHQRITISHETTFITKPLLADGLPDYVAVINKLGGSGMQPKNNAFIPIFDILSANGKALGFGWKKEMKLLGSNRYEDREPPLESIAEFFREHLPPKLQIEANAEKLFPDCKYAWDNPDTATAFAWTELDQGGRGPWHRAVCPLLFRYIASNQAALDRIGKLVKLPGYFQPLYPRNPEFPLFGSPDLSARLDNLAQVLLARANLRLAHSDVAGCEADLMAIHRLSRLLMQRQFSSTEFITAGSIDQYATNGDRILMQYPELSARQAGQYTQRLLHLAHFPSMLQTVNIGGRFDWLQLCIGGYEQFRKSRSLRGKFAGSLTNWNATLRQINSGYNNLAKYFRHPIYSPKDRQIAMDIKGYATKLNDRRRFTFIGQSGEWDWIIASDIKDMMTLRRVNDWHISAGRLTRIGFAIAAYHLERGDYPKSLAELCPKYLQTIPFNPLTGKLPVYARTASGYTLSSPDPFTHKGTSWQFRRGLIIQIPARVKPSHKKISLP